MNSNWIRIHAYNLIRWATFRLQKVKKKRERWKNKAREGKDEKEDKALKREKPPHLVCVFFFLIFYYKTGEILKCWRPFFGPLIEVMAEYIYVKKSPGIRNVFIPVRMVDLNFEGQVLTDCKNQKKAVNNPLFCVIQVGRV